jgi:hypothetical protein
LVIGDIEVIEGAVGGEYANGDGDSAGRDRISRDRDRVGRSWRTGCNAVVGTGPTGGIGAGRPVGGSGITGIG